MTDCLVKPQASAARNGDHAAIVSARVHIFRDHALQMPETVMTFGALRSLSEASALLIRPPVPQSTAIDCARHPPGPGMHVV